MRGSGEVRGVRVQRERRSGLSNQKVTQSRPGRTWGNSLDESQGVGKGRGYRSARLGQGWGGENWMFSGGREHEGRELSGERDLEGPTTYIKTYVTVRLFAHLL